MTNLYAQNQYKQQAMSTLSPGEQLVALYDGIIKNLNHAVILYDKGDFEVADAKAEKAKKIFDYLIEVLDFNVSVSNDLFKFYLFFKQEIIYAQIARSPKHINDILPLITDMRDTWTQATRNARIQRQSQGTATGSSAAVN